MKSIQLTVLVMAIACTLFCCKKNIEDDGQDCMDTHITKVTFSNTGTTPLRVEVSIALTPQFKSINPVVSLDLAPGASVNKEFIGDRYFIVWSRDCSTSCNMVTYYSKTYDECNEYTEKQGI